MKKGEEDSMDEEEASKPETQPPSKKRKAAEKTVVRVTIEGGFSTQKNESPPSDSWSWRKYGQKPIKGSPFPRGYYRCSTSKGCSAKKQVERCKTEDSVLVITYTSSHNHPDPRTPTAKQKLSLKEQEQEQEQEQEEQEQGCGHPYKTSPSKDEFHYLDQAIDLFSTVNHMETEAGTTISMGLAMLEEEEGVVPRPPGLPEFVKTEEMEEMENDFFDELEELFPTVSSSFKRVLFEERVPDAVSSS